jgi:competence protein ComEA
MNIRTLLAAGLTAALWATAATAGPVNVNSADARTLARELKGVGASKAQAIVTHRDKNGPYKSADELAKVKGIGKKLVDRNRENLRFEAGGDKAKGAG